MNNKILYAVPFHPQKWDLSTWKQMGYLNEDDARYWEKSCCGILCLQMAFEYYFGKKINTRALIEEGRALNGYTDATGWSHAGLVTLAKDHGVLADSVSVSPQQIASEIELGSLVIISIKWGFRSDKTARERVLFWKKYGGHLALVIGVKKTEEKLEGFYVHHTSIREGYNWESRFVSVEDFQKGYTGRAIILPDPRVDAHIPYVGK